MQYNSQYGQDKYIIEYLNFKKDGTFVDVGAAHPIELSNTYVLENELNWSGLLIETDEYFLSLLQQQRTSKVVDACIWNIPDIQVSYMLTDKTERGYGNHIYGFGVPHASIFDKDIRTTTTLQDVLQTNGSPHIIDYLSIDVEGAELNVLQSVDLSMYKFRIMTIEENNKQIEILNYLQPYGYVLDTILQNPGLYEKELVIINKDLI